MTAPRSVVHVIGALPVGGVERNMIRVLPRLDPARFRVSVVCLRERGDLAAEMEAAGIPVRLVRFRTRLDPASLWRLRRHFLEEKAEIVHCHMRRANTSGRIAGLLAGVPVLIATERDLGLDKTRWHYRIDRWLGRRSACVLCVSKAVLAHEQVRSGLPVSAFRVLYNGLDFAPFENLPPRAEVRAALGLPAEAKVVGALSRLEEIKNLDAVLRAFARPELAGVHLLLAGDGRERGALERLARDLGLGARATDRAADPGESGARVHFTGWRSDLAALYAALDASVLASRSESFANVILESLAAGVPLVSTPVGIAEEALEPGRDWLRVATHDPALLAAALGEALRPERAAVLREAGRAAVRPFTLEAQARNLAALYDSFSATGGS